MKKNFLAILMGVFGFAIVGSVGLATNAAAAEGEFNLQVSPSPMVLTLKPGETSVHDLKIRNIGTQVEKLQIAPRSFSIDNVTGEVKLDDTKTPPEIGDWIQFASREFVIQPGQTFTQKVTFAIPESAGFSYSFSLVITRQDESATTQDGRKIKPKVAIFSLINIDKPGATRKLELQEFSTDQNVYEYLPAKINVRFKNTGNSIVRPAGNIFVQRGSNDSRPINTLSVNPGEGYILPGSFRTLSTEWNDGFQVVHTSTDPTGKSQQNVEWNWSNLSHLRIGKYTAKLVAIYNDGQRDVPVVGEVSFWVIPWKLLLGTLIVLVILGVGIWSIVGRLFDIKRRKTPVKFRR
jgi:hypothetical protein